MHAIQYEITLPADYDMDVIRQRVATRGSATDDFPGLGLKAYGIRVWGRDGSPVNQYAPFYLWTSLRGMNQFLWGGWFRGLRESFGRPSVLQWTGIAFEPGPAIRTIPAWATRHLEPVPADVEPEVAISRALDELAQLALLPEVHSVALGIDTRRWELVQLVLSGRPLPDHPGTRYEVLHLSAPDLQDLEPGRHW